MPTSSLEYAKYYWVNDIPSATITGSRLNNVLVSLGKGQPLTAISKGFLASKGLRAANKTPLNLSLAMSTIEA